MIQANIDCLYSEEKALLKYSNFLNEFKVEIVYEEKKEAKDNGQSEKKPQRVEKEEKIESEVIILPQTTYEWIK